MPLEAAGRTSAPREVERPELARLFEAESGGGAFILHDAGADSYVRSSPELAALMPPEGPPAMSKIVALAGRYGLEFDIEALPALLEAHRLRLG